MPTPPDEAVADAALEDDMLDVALAAAREAAGLQRNRAGTLPTGSWSEKGTSDFVTEVDRESERRIVARIRAAFPEHAVLAEEGARDGPADDAPEILWVVDPLDGTTNWLHGYPEYAVSIAALDVRGLRVAVVLNSATGETFTAIRGRGARRDDAAIRVSEVSELRLALLGTGFPFKRAELIPDYLRVLGRLLRRTSGVRRGGAAALDLCDVACGRLDAFWEHWLMPWDVAAGALVLREAGGTFAGLPGGGSGPLGEAAAAGADVAAAFDGRGARGSLGLDTVRGAAFMAGNGRVDGALRTLLEETLEGG